MSTLILVRHGQACAFSDDPDQLSSVGWKQSRQLGRYWASHGIVFDAVFYGTLKRQRETCHAISEEYATQGLPWPEARELMGLDEYHAQQIVSEMAPRLADHDKSFAELWNSWNSSTRDLANNRLFQKMFEALIHQWVAGRIAQPGLESWEAFRQRVKDALNVIRKEHSGGKHLAVLTSGGPIGIAVQECLQAPPRAALEVNWRVRNTSLTTFLFSESRLSLDGFNELPHLASMLELVTFR